VHCSRECTPLYISTGISHLLQLAQAEVVLGQHSMYLASWAEMRYCKISKEMLSLYFGLAVLCQIEARVSESDPVFSVQCILYCGGVACQILGH
jgi:hypothetical protein